MAACTSRCHGKEDALLRHNARTATDVLWHIVCLPLSPGSRTTIPVRFSGIVPTGTVCFAQASPPSLHHHCLWCHSSVRLRVRDCSRKADTMNPCLSCTHRCPASCQPFQCFASFFQRDIHLCYADSRCPDSCMPVSSTHQHVRLNRVDRSNAPALHAVPLPLAVLCNL